MGKMKELDIIVRNGKFCPECNQPMEASDNRISPNPLGFIPTNWVCFKCNVTIPIKLGE